MNENKPIYLQLADQIMDETERPGFEPDGRLPSVREYAAGSGVNPNTVMRTYTWLQQEEIIYNKRGVGFFFSPSAREKVREMRRSQFFAKDLPYLIERMKALGISPQDIETAFKN